MKLFVVCKRQRRTGTSCAKRYKQIVHKYVNARREQLGYI